MQLIRELWQDEHGLVLSAEMVTVSTLGVLGAVAGLNVAASAVNDEMIEFARAIRSLDQSYSAAAHHNCVCSKAGSSYQQQSVEASLKELCDVTAPAAKEIQKHVEQKKFEMDLHIQTERATPVPNQIKVEPKDARPESKPELGKPASQPEPKKKKKKDKEDDSEV